MRKKRNHLKKILNLQWGVEKFRRKKRSSLLYFYQDCVAKQQLKGNKKENNTHFFERIDAVHAKIMVNDAQQ